MVQLTLTRCLSLQLRAFVSLAVYAARYGNFLYAEFTAVDDWNFEAVSFHEAFDLAKDPHQLNNIYHDQSSALQAELHTLLEAEWKCTGETCQ